MRLSTPNKPRRHPRPRDDRSGRRSGRRGPGSASGAFVGMGAVVLEGRTIGERAIVGAGSVVTPDVAPCTKVIGAPARERATDGDCY
jgi:acetyltransferase-like isoleucine patch superfamily enzyme